MVVCTTALVNGTDAQRGVQRGRNLDRTVPDRLGLDLMFCASLTPTLAFMP